MADSDLPAPVPLSVAPAGEVLPLQRAGSALIPIPISSGAARNEAVLSSPPDSDEEETGILVIDDSEPSRKEIVSIIQESHLFDRCMEAGGGAEGIKALQQARVDIILCDVNMPGFDGLKVLDFVRKQFRFKEIPVIMLTGARDVETKVRCFDLGASDYVEKGNWQERGPELNARIRTHLELKRSRDRLRRLASVDELTRVYNRRHFIEVLEREFSRAVRHQKPISFIMLDIDRFKQINDTYGHQTGDRVLKQLANLVKQTLRVSDIVARYGGEEFAVILPETELEGAAAAAEKTRKSVERYAFPGPEGPLAIRASFGVSNWPRHKVNDVDQLIRIADDALYYAKDTGRNRVIVAQV